MQSKGFIRVIAVLLVLICAFYLSFSFVSNHFQNKAAQVALAANSDENSEEYKNAYKTYIDSIAKEKVYLGYYTFQQVQEKEVGLGLDLKGGMNVTLQISVPDILRTLAGTNADDAKFQRALATTDSLMRAGKSESDVVNAFCAEYARINPGVNFAQVFRGISSVKSTDDNAHVAAILQKEVTAQIDNSYNVLRNRIDKFGVVAPNIQKLERQGQILLELPGVKEPERVRKLLQGSANLEFYEVFDGQRVAAALAELSQLASQGAPKAAADTAATAAAANDSTAVAAPEAAKAADERTLAQMIMPVGFGDGYVGNVAIRDTMAVNQILNSPLAKRVLPGGLKFAWAVKPDTDENGKELNYLMLYALKTTAGKPILNGDVIDEARDDFDQMQRPVVSMTMNGDGTQKWARITANNIGRAIAIVLDDQVYSAPRVNGAIEGGRSEISGNFTPEETKDLSNVLKSGKMVAKVNIVSESVIGPSLGKAAIKAGFISFIVALVLLAIFMICVYGFGPGLVADMCLVLNLFFTLGILASLQAVLTLSGIAGIVLSLGMAVDANVLIYERTKEELRAGKNLKNAVADGYKNAFSAIFDSNLTSVITGVILLIYGTGPIKGFATTTVIGIACSFFTAVFISRLVIEHFVNKDKWKNVTFTTAMSKKLWVNSSFNFIDKGRISAIVAIVLIALFGLSFGLRWFSLGIDFSGGRNYIVQFDHPVNTNQLESQLAPEFGGLTPNVITIDNDTKVRISTNYKIDDNAETVDDEIMTKLYNGLKSELGTMSQEDFSTSNESVGVVSAEKVGPSIAQDITRGAIWAVALSLLAMALYILIRFRNVAFSIGALAAVAFTAFIIIGLYSALYGILPFAMEIDQSFIAAILTVIGYQVNDTVVVFDRVRENHGLYPKQDWKTTFNTALNSTLTRTVMTSVTTFLVLAVIFIFGGESIRSLVFALLCGVVIGTFCSLFIAAPTAYSVITRLQARKKAADKAKK